MKKLFLVSGAVLLAAILIWKARSPAAPELMCQGKPVSAWALALNSAGTQRQAEEVILSLGSNAVPSLVRLLRTPDPILARTVKAIGRRTPDKLSRVLYQMVNPFAAPAQRARAAQALRILGPAAISALPALTNALSDDQTVSWYAALTLAQLGEPGITALSGALPKSAPAQAGYICYALGTQGPSASNAIPVLATVMETGPAQVAERAASALADIGRLAVPRLLQTLEHPDPAVRILAINALARLGPPARAALPRLIDVAKEDQAIVRVMAIDALPKIRPTGAGLVGVLTNALQDPDPQVRVKATQALEKLQLAR